MNLKEQMKKELDMLEKIYDARQEDFELENRKDREILKEKQNNVRLEDIEGLIKTDLEKDIKLDQKEELINMIEQLVENYEIAISYYSEKNYKQGFKDAVSLLMQCLGD